MNETADEMQAKVQRRKMLLQRSNVRDQIDLPPFCPVVICNYALPGNDSIFTPKTFFANTQKSFGNI